MRSMRCAVLGIALGIPAFAGAIITNGSGVWLGVDNFGQLNVTNGTGGVTLPLIGFTNAIGLYSDLIHGDATSPSCFCEGWGVAANGTFLAGADNARMLPLGKLQTFASASDTALSIVDAGPLTITHMFAPSVSESLFEGTVTITNNSQAVLQNLLYRRLVDWDVTPTPGKEYVTIQGWPSSALYRTSNGGFQYPNPLAPTQGIGTLTSLGPGGCPENENFTDCGWRDQGALFDFNFGSLAPGESRTFRMYYGWNRTEEGALEALNTVGAEVYSLAQSFDDRDGTGFGADGSPRVTFMLGFGDVNEVIQAKSFRMFDAAALAPTPVPESGSMMMLGSACFAALLLGRRRLRPGRKNNSA